MTDQRKIRWHRWMFLFVFVYTLSLGLFIQLVFLPHLAPSMHMAGGILTGNYDAYTFHTQARGLANLIIEKGWSQWEWRVGSSGISSLLAILYVFFGPHIWLIMPYNALVHAFAVLVLYDLFRSIFPGLSQRTYLLGTLPYAFFPSTLLWTTQLHKDGLSFLAAFMLFWVIVRVMKYDCRVRSWRYALWLCVVCVLGQFFLWWFKEDRIFFFELFFGFCILGAVVSWMRKRFGSNRSALTCIGLLVIMMTSGAWFFFWDVRPTIRAKHLTKEELEERKAFSPDLEQWNSEHWKSVSWLPEQVDSRLAQLTEIRNRYLLIHWKPNSPIDRDYAFTSAYDILRYTPRMLLISYFAPFPADWLDEGSTGTATVMKRIVSLETLLVYLSFVGLVGLLWKHWRNPHLWYLLFMVTVFMMIYVYVFPNMGTLYRQRFGFLSLVTGLGLIGIASWFEKRSQETVSIRIIREEPELTTD